MEISFVVRTRNEERYVGYAIQSIIDFFGSKTPIFVIDNDSCDETIKVVNLFSKKFYNIEITNIAKNEYTPGKALNIGIKQAKTEFVGILSSHSVITQIGNLNEIFKNDNVFGFIGKQIPIYKGKKITPKYVWQNFEYTSPVKNLIENTEQKRYFFHNAFSFIRKKHWKIHGFNEQLSGKEDRFWAEDLINIDKNLHFWFDPTFKAEHHWTQNGATWAGIG